MAISYQYIIEGNVLKIATSGKDDSLEQVENYAIEVLGLSIQNKCTKILCDERNLDYTLSMIDTYSLAEKASQEAADLHKIAIVCKEKYLEDGKFFETVSSNRGLSILVTSNIDQAKEWLK
jgi:hypothetical protein